MICELFSDIASILLKIPKYAQFKILNIVFVCWGRLYFSSKMSLTVQVIQSSLRKAPGNIGWSFIAEPRKKTPRIPSVLSPWLTWFFWDSGGVVTISARHASAPVSPQAFTLRGIIQPRPEKTCEIVTGTKIKWQSLRGCAWSSVLAAGTHTAV